MGSGRFVAWYDEPRPAWLTATLSQSGWPNLSTECFKAQATNSRHLLDLLQELGKDQTLSPEAP